MSAASDEEEKAAGSDVVMCCACCGKPADDDIKLKICTACKLVKYCSVECQKNHRPKHKKACKKKAAELRDDKLFTQPDESFLGECPICCLPLPIDLNKSGVNSCCCKWICNGCKLANKKREWEQGLEPRCVYCREPMPKTQEEADQNFMKRAKANDPIALFNMGSKCRKEGDSEGTVQYWTKAAELGDSESHFNLSLIYAMGEGVEKDKKKQIYHLEEAAIGGHPWARFNLGAHEERAGRYDRAIKYWFIASSLGFDRALNAVKKCFQNGDASKEDYEAALRGHQAAVDATKSKQREEAYAFYNLSPE